MIEVTSTGLDGILKSLKIKRVFVAGLALDFCVQYTAIDSAKLGYRTYVLKDATLSCRFRRFCGKNN